MSTVTWLALRQPQLSDSKSVSAQCYLFVDFVSLRSDSKRDNVLKKSCMTESFITILVQYFPVRYNFS